MINKYNANQNVNVHFDEQRLRTIINCNNSIFNCTINCNTNLFFITVYQQGDLVEKSVPMQDFIDFIHPDDRKLWLEQLAKSVECENNVMKLTFRSTFLSIDYRWYEIDGRGVTDEGVTSIIGVMRDVNKVVCAEESLERSTNFLNNICNNTPFGMMLFDRTGALIDVNHVAMDILDIQDTDQIYGLNIFEDMGLPQSFKEQLKSGAKVDQVIKYNFDKAHKAFNFGAVGEKTLSVNGVPLFDKDNNISNFLVVSTDDTEAVKSTNRVRDFEKFFAAVIGFARVGYCKWNLLSKQGFAIDQWFENMGGTPEDNIDDIICHYKNVHPDDRPILIDSIDQIVCGKIQSSQHEVRVLCGGVYKWIFLKLMVTNYQPKEHSLEVMCVNVEISHHKDTELRLLEANQQTTALAAQRDLMLNNLSSALVYIDNNYVVKWESTVGLRRSYSDKAYIPGHVCYRTAYNRTTPCDNCPLAKMMASGKTESVQIVRDGVDIEVVANPAYDAAGNTVGGVIRLDDITQRKHDERKINELNVLMNAILDNIPVYVFVKDPNHAFKYLYWNKAMVQHTNIPMEYVIDKTDDDIFSCKEDVQQFRINDLKLLETMSSVECDEQFYGADNKLHTTHCVRTLIPSQDKLPWLMGVSWDVTEIRNKEVELVKAKEKAEESDRFKSSFLANMSHEIRTPLNAIVGFSELLIDEQTDPVDAKEYLAIIQKNNRLLLQLISDIIDLSRIEAKELDFNYAIVNVNTMCSMIATSANVSKDAKVPILFDDKMPNYYIRSDENRVNQIITNLVTNAMKFTENGSIVISYCLLSDTEIEISVTDTGMGIPVEKLNTIFDRFTKLNTFVQGSGLGLSICKNLVEQFGGRIGVDSEYGSGSHFWFTLPFDKNITLSDQLSEQ